MRRRIKLFACLCFAMLLLVSFCMTHTAALEPPKSDTLIFHSWEELKRLYDASQKSNDEFLAEVAALDEECDLSMSGHVDFDVGYYDEVHRQSKQTFISYYEKIADQKVLVPKDLTVLPVKEIWVSSSGYGENVNSYSIYYQIEYSDETFIFQTNMERNYSGPDEGEPIAQMKGDGYTVKIWKNEAWGERELSCSAYYYLDGKENPSFHVKMTCNDWPWDVPRTIRSLFSQFRITTAEEMLTEIAQKQEQDWEPASSRAWIWVAAGVAGVAILGTGVILRKRRKTQAQQSE